MYIGEVSRRTGLSVKAIRFYEEKGLIHKPQRVGHYRVYGESDVNLLLLIKEAKSLGVTLSQLKGVVEYIDGEVDWARIKMFLADLRLQLLSAIEDLHRKIEYIDKCSSQISA
jgi:MerR family transcriptional regulator, copper efflux regulator